MTATGNGKEGKSKMIAWCRFLVDELRQCSKEGGVTMADSVETFGVDLRNESKEVGNQRKREGRSARCDSRLPKKNNFFQKNYMKVGAKKLLRAGMVPARTWEVHALGMALQRDLN